MTTKAQRGILWGALFLFAFLGGSFLGRFVTMGLAGGGKMLAGDNSAANFWEQQDRARNAGARAAPTNVAIVQRDSGAHVCDGCDASALRLRPPGNQMFQYDPPAADTGTGGGTAAPPAPPPPLPHL